jgi:hypothetical protein
MTESLWEGYNKMFAACGRRLERLLTKGWDNSNGERLHMRYTK